VAVVDRLRDRFVVVPAAYVFLLRDGVCGVEVLLQLRQGTGYMDDHWAAAAAGPVERGGTADDAAHREARAEIGVGDLDHDAAAVSGVGLVHRAEAAFADVAQHTVAAIQEITQGQGPGHGLARFRAGLDLLGVLLAAVGAPGHEGGHTGGFLRAKDIMVSKTR
jgi:hypothetical protein